VGGWLREMNLGWKWGKKGNENGRENKESKK